jgi:hypothetical protein
MSWRKPKSDFHVDAALEKIHVGMFYIYDTTFGIFLSKDLDHQFGVPE